MFRRRTTLSLRGRGLRRGVLERAPMVYSLTMNLQEIPLECIDFEDQTFRISEELEPPAMRSSLAGIGQLNPVLLLEDQGRRIIVCGFRRLHALRALHRSVALTYVRSSAGCSRLEAFRLAILDNLSFREFNPLEKARIFFTLKNSCGVAHDSLVETYLPLLSLPGHKNVLRTYLGLHVLAPDLRKLFNEGRLTLATMERLSGVPGDAQRRFARLLALIRLSASRQRELLDLADELAAITETLPGEIFERPEIESVLADSRLTAFQKGEQIQEMLYRWRYPRISRAEETFRSETRQLGLPGVVRISPDPHFETPRLRVEFDAGSPERFREIAAALQEAANTPVLERLYQVS